MKKTAIAVLTASVLLAFSLPVMSAPGEIEIKVEKDSNGVYYIDMGEKYAYAVPERSNVKWICKHPFAILFEGESPFEMINVADSPRVKEKKIKEGAVANHIYKYTVSVAFGDASPLMLDPVIIIIPPRR